MIPLIAVGAVIIVVVVVLAVRGVTLPGGIVDLGNGQQHDGCPTEDASGPTEPPPPGDRTTSGRLSMMRLPPPFGEPQHDRRIPYAHDVRSQEAVVEQAENGSPTWVANVAVARLLAGDGFYGPEQGAQLMFTCTLGRVFHNIDVRRNDVKNQATKVDGHAAWVIESQLSFRVPDIDATGELMIIVVVDVGNEGESGLFYASVPDTAPELVAPARKALADLRVV